ncbi:hypothetical protein [Paracoccus sp. (in: a-proteobacteria)]|uniref:hypothetical protein n=1 Tax=Paracoccus sp. TaxID=267 RepID=UPI00396CFFE3
MCSACGYPPAPGHWTDAGAVTPRDRMRNRLIRMTVVNRILAPYRLKAQDDGIIPGIQLSSGFGATVIVPDLDALWVEAGRMAGRPIDPLADV